jgi:SulP family sulfate permease
MLNKLNIIEEGTNTMLKPKILTTLRDYSWKQFIADASAGTIVGIVALPLAIAFAIASGVTPDKGLITAVIAGFLISIFGGSRVQIGGPTGAFVVIVYGIVQKYGLDGLTIATVMAGIILIIMGLARFGSMIKFIPFPVIAGFTSGIAIIIFSSQVHEFLGLNIPTIPSEFISKWHTYLQFLSTINFASFGIGMFSLVLILLWPRVSQRIPGALMALIFSSIIVYLFKLPVETIGTRFGEISAAFPTPVWPKMNLAIIKDLISPALTIAILAGIEALLSAVVADGMIGGRHRSNMELVANGIANLVTPLFGGIPATGAIARTATNIKNGGRTPIAGVIHALILLVIMLFFGRWASLIPLPCLAAILMVVAYNMSEWRSFVRLLKSPRSDVVVLLVTFLLTVLLDLTIALEVGLLLAVFLFMRRMAKVTNIDIITKELEDTDELSDLYGIADRNIPAQVEVYEINGPLFFGAAYKFEETLKNSRKHPRVLIIRMRNVPAIDSTGLHILRQIIHTFQKQHASIILSGVCAQPIEALKGSGLVSMIGPENIQKTIDDSLARAQQILGCEENEGKIVSQSQTLEQ